MAEHRPRRSPLVTLGATTTAGGSDDALDVEVGDAIAAVLADGEPRSAEEIRREVQRRKLRVLRVLGDDPRFEQCGHGRRWSKWRLADENVRTGARERRHDVGTAEVTSGLPPEVTGPQNVSQDADAESEVSANASVRMRARARETVADGSGEPRAWFPRGVADMRLPTSPARGLNEAQEIAHLTGLPLSDESSRSTMPPWRRRRDG